MLSGFKVIDENLIIYNKRKQKYSYSFVMLSGTITTHYKRVTELCLLHSTACLNER